MRRILAYLLVTFLFGACGGKEKVPSGIIPPGRMARITADVLMAREANTQKKNVFDKQDIHPLLAVMKDYGIDTVRYYRSLEWYGKHPEIFQRVYTLTDSIIQHRLDSLDLKVKVKRDTSRNHGQGQKNKVKKVPFPFGES